jgi:hypothetical protein
MGDLYRPDLVEEAYITQPFPDKYDEHHIDAKVCDLLLYLDSDAPLERQKNPLQHLPGPSALRSANMSQILAGPFGDEDGEIQKALEKYLDEKEVAKALVSKWFNRDSEGTFSMDLVSERGAYNASVLDAEIASGSAMGFNLLRDSGEELIGQTFVLFSYLNFIENEPVAALARDMLAKEANKFKGIGKIKGKVGVSPEQEVYKKLREGYTVWTTSYLYQLDWNTEVMNQFYMDYWIPRGVVNAERKNKFDESDLFKLNFIGKVYTTTVTIPSLFKSVEEEEVIRTATVRNLDASYASLQKEYDAFKPSVPLLTAEPITANIGMKEGLEGGEKFEVLEIVQNPETGARVYKKVTTITVDKDKIWDNRYNAEIYVQEGEQPGGLDRTHFKGSSKGLMQGMLIKQLK